MLPNPRERLVLNIGSAVTVVPNDDPRRVGFSICGAGTLAVATADVAVVMDMNAADWAVLAEVAATIACALAQRDPALAAAAALDMAGVAGHA